MRITRVKSGEKEVNGEERGIMGTESRQRGRYELGLLPPPPSTSAEKYTCTVQPVLCQFFDLMTRKKEMYPFAASKVKVAAPCY